MRISTRGRTGRTARVKFAVSVMCMALLLGASLPAGASEDASLDEAFAIYNGYVGHGSCDGKGLEFVAQFVGLSDPLRAGNLYICSELDFYDTGDLGQCWKGIDGTGLLDNGAGELYDLRDVTIERVYAHVAGQLDAVNPYPQDTAWLTSQVPHFLVEGSYVRRSDQSHGRLQIIAPVAGFQEYDCERKYQQGFYQGSGALRGGPVPAA